MAVKAQYSSNVLLFNRNTQEGKDTIGSDSSFFDHQPHMLFSSGGVNNITRKRSRELISTMNNIGPSMALQQSQPSSQIINLSQNHPNNVVSTGLRLSFGDKLQQQKHPLHQQSMLSSQSSQISSNFLPFLSDDLDFHIKHQQEEIDNFINFQGEQLRHALAEIRQRHAKILLSLAEGSVSRRLRQKEAEVEKAFRHNAELEARAAQLSAEAQAWQARAREQELNVAALQAQLQHAMERDEWGCDGGGEGVATAAEDAESAYIDPDRVSVLDGPSCKACRRRVATMVVLPCRHLCLCIECDRVARCCPLCYTFRNSSVEVVLG